MGKQFKIFYPADHPDENLRGKEYKPTDAFVVMNDSGVFFQVSAEPYSQYIVLLSTVLPKYDVVLMFRGE